MVFILKRSLEHLNCSIKIQVNTCLIVSFITLPSNSDPVYNFESQKIESKIHNRLQILDGCNSRFNHGTIIQTGMTCKVITIWEYIEVGMALK